MSKLTKFIGIAQEVDIKGEKLKIFPLTIKDLGLIERMDELEKKKNNLSEEDRKEIAKLGRDLIKACFKEENFTDEEIESMSMDLYSELYAAIMEKMYEMKDGKGLTRIRELKAKAIQQQPV
jgi:hypothetical protein